MKFSMLCALEIPGLSQHSPAPQKKNKNSKIVRRCCMPRQSPEQCTVLEPTIEERWGIFHRRYETKKLFSSILLSRRHRMPIQWGRKGVNYYPDFHNGPNRCQAVCRRGRGLRRWWWWWWVGWWASALMVKWKRIRLDCCCYRNPGWAKTQLDEMLIVMIAYKMNKVCTGCSSSRSSLN